MGYISYALPLGDCPKTANLINMGIVVKFTLEIGSSNELSLERSCKMGTPNK